MREAPVEHFKKRAQKYNASSHWVHDPALIDKMFSFAEVTPDSTVLDIAIGTGKISRAFFGRAGRVVGIDMCMDMVKGAKGASNAIVLGVGERLPFLENSFDVCVCRQGLQFMDAEAVIAEAYRVLKPSGRIVLCHLTAHGTADKDTAFLVQRLRNPARRNFFLPDDFLKLLKTNRFTDVELFEYLSRESVNVWIDHGAITSGEMEEIREAYRNAPAEFKKTHCVEFIDNDIMDTMKLVIARGRKP